MKLRKYEIDYKFNLWPTGHGELVLKIGNPDGDLKFHSIVLNPHPGNPPVVYPADHHRLVVTMIEVPYEYNPGDIEVRSTGVVQEGITIQSLFATIDCVDLQNPSVIRSRRRTNTTVSNVGIELVKG